VWVEGGDIQDELLDQLGAVLTAPEADPGDTPGPPGLALTPSAAEFEALAAAVAARWPDVAAPADPASPGSTIERTGSVHLIRPAGWRPLRRLGSSAWRAGSVAAGIVVFSASAAAANGGVPIPRPVRVVAYSVGLPVDSPALDDTNRHVEDLKKAVKANDKPKAQATARRLQTDLTKVPGHEKAEAEQKVVAVMAIAEQLIVAPSTTTTSTAPAPSTTATTAASPTTTATTAEEEEKEREKDKARATTTTTAPTTTTTTDPESTTTSTAPETDETPSDGSGTPSGEPGTGSGDPGAGGAGTGGGDQGSTTPTTTPDGGTTTTTIPDGGGASGGGDPGSTTTTTSSTTTTTMPPPDPGTATP
jgi:hypothetical protein